MIYENDISRVIAPYEWQLLDASVFDRCPNGCGNWKDQCTCPKKKLSWAGVAYFAGFTLYIALITWGVLEGYKYVGR